MARFIGLVPVARESYFCRTPARPPLNCFQIFEPATQTALADRDLSFGEAQFSQMIERLRIVHLVVDIDLPTTGDLFQLLNDALYSHCTRNNVLHHYSALAVNDSKPLFWILAKPSRDTATGHTVLKPPIDEAANPVDGLPAELVRRRYVHKSAESLYLFLGIFVSRLCYDRT